MLCSRSTKVIMLSLKLETLAAELDFLVGSLFTWIKKLVNLLNEIFVIFSVLQRSVRACHCMEAVSLSVFGHHCSGLGRRGDELDLLNPFCKVCTSGQSPLL